MPAWAVGSCSETQLSASGSAASALSASLTSGPWCVERTESFTGRSRPLTVISSSRSASASHSPSNR